MSVSIAYPEGSKRFSLASLARLLNGLKKAEESDEHAARCEELTVSFDKLDWATKERVATGLCCLWEVMQEQFGGLDALLSAERATQQAYLAKLVAAAE